MNKIKIAYICVHNSCRSQMAEAITKQIAGDVFEAYSAGTKVKDNINQDAVRIIKEYYHVDMLQEQYNKLLEALPPVDIVVTMGCNVHCPNVPCQYKEDWGLEDPTGKNEEAFLTIIKKIEHNVLRLREKYQ